MEVLVAVSVLAISLVVILQLFSGGLRSAKLAGDYTRGIFYAKAKMEEVLATELLEEKTLTGVFDDIYRWEARIVAFDLESEEEEPVLPIVAFNVNLQVVWNMGSKERRFELSTLKLRKKDQDEMGDRRPRGAL
jgi:general secretion pathway protein I